jgi:hypothetical protein
MDADIITSAPHPSELAPAPRAAPFAIDARLALVALARMVRARARVLYVLARGKAHSSQGPRAPRPSQVAGAAGAETSARAASAQPAVVPPGAIAAGAIPAAQPAAAAAAHVLRVRARLAPAEQARFDQLVRDRAGEALVAALLRRDEEEALELARRELARTEQISPATVARQIGRLRAHLATADFDRVIARLPHLSGEELVALAGHLRVMDAGSAALLLRAYLAVSRACPASAPSASWETRGAGPAATGAGPS